jgi:hypothetical protein
MSKRKKAQWHDQTSEQDPQVVPRNGRSIFSNKDLIEQLEELYGDVRLEEAEEKPIVAFRVISDFQIAKGLRVSWTISSSGSVPLLRVVAVLAALVPLLIVALQPLVRLLQSQ